jgi:hypothetical protein
MNKRYLSFQPIPALIDLISVPRFSFMSSIFYDSQWLFLLRNTQFITVTGLCSAGQAPRYTLAFNKEQ